MKNFLRSIAVLALSLLGCALLHAEDMETFSITGSVTDTNGQPITGVTVDCYSYANRTAMTEDQSTPLARLTTDTNGTFEVTVSRSVILLLTRHEGYAPAWRQLNATPDTKADLTLSSPSLVAGVVVDEEDKPVADAEVYVSSALGETLLNGMRRSYSYLSGPLARDCFSTHTTTDGRFRIENFPANAAADLAILAEGKVLPRPSRQYTGFDTMMCRSGETNLHLVVETAGSIDGKIIFDATDEPPALAKLYLQPEGGGGFGSSAMEPATSQLDGTFHIPNVAAGSYRVRAVFGTNEIPDWVADSVPASVESGQTTSGVELQATHGSLLEVTVLHKDSRKPLSGVFVSAYRQGVEDNSTTDEKGIAVLRLTAGDHQINVSRQGWTADNTQANIEPGTTNHVEIELSPPPTIRGVVRFPDGQPAAGLDAQIVGAYSPDQQQTKTDKDGRFELEWNPQRYGRSDVTFCLLIRDPERNLAIASEIDEDMEPLDLKLEPGLTMVGRAECEGIPLTNATAALVFWAGNMGMHMQGFSTGTNTPGHFEIPALPPDRRYGVYVTAPGYGQQYVDTQEFQGEAGRVELEPVELRPANMKLAGQVLDADDQPVAGANVSLNGEGQPNGNTRTDTQGRFQFDQVCEGAVRLFANALNSYGDITAEGGDTNVVLRLGDSYGAMGATSRTLTGTVTDPQGNPVAEAQVAVFPENSSRWVKTDSKGEFKLTWSIQPWQLQSGGDPCLVVRDLANNLAASEDILEESTNLTVQLSPALTLKGHVEDIDGQPLSGAQVGMWLLACNTYSDFNGQPTVTDNNGDFEIKTLPHGPQYRIYATARDYGRSQRNLDQDAETTQMTLEPFVLKRADQIIKGQVVNEDEKPLSGVNVSLNGDDQPQGSDTTDRQGRFSFKVCEGTVRLFASSMNGYADTTAEAGNTNVIIQLINNRSISGRAVQRVSLKGKLLPDLSELGLSTDDLPSGKPMLLCLVDVEQRPSRRAARLLSEKQEALQQKGVELVIAQATVIDSETFQTWKTDAGMKCPVGQVKEKNKAKWATGVEALPWLILTDAESTVSAEGFPLDDLDAKLETLSQ